MRGPGSRSAMVIAAVALVLAAMTVSAQSPAPSSPTLSSSPTPFPWPTLRAPESVPVGEPFEPSGSPAASTSRHGVRIELWLSSQTVAPGEWVQAVLRTTNLGADAAWASPGSCDSSGTHVQADVGDAIPRGGVRAVALAGGRAAIRDTRGDTVPVGHLPPPVDDPALPTFEPSGPPDARGRRFGVVTEPWLSSPTVGQGEWIQAHVRVTNTRDDAVWGPGCSLPTQVSVDLADVYAPGATWEGNAAASKHRVIRDCRLLTGGFEAQGWGRRSSGVVVSTALALLDCGGTGGDVARLGPGQVFDVDSAWYPMDTFDVYDQWVRPPPSGRRSRRGAA